MCRDPRCGIFDVYFFSVAPSLAVHYPDFTFRNKCRRNFGQTVTIYGGRRVGENCPTYMRDLNSR